MSDKPQSFDVQFPPGGLDVENLSAVTVAFYGALHDAVDELKVIHGTKNLDWFDQLHQRALKTAKGSVIDKISVEMDTKRLHFGVDVLDATLKALRARLVDESNKG